MSTRFVMTILAAGLISSTVAFAQDHSQTTTETETTTEASTSTYDQGIGKEEVPVTLVGCLQQESDYRREHDRGKGGFFGRGMGDEFILINATRLDSPGTPVADASCSSASTGDAYELTGENEDNRDLRAFVGRRVVVTGYIKKADTEIAANGEVRPSGGHFMDGGDLRLWEVHIDGFSEPVIARARVEREPQIFAQAQPEYVPPIQEPQAVGTTGQQPAPVMELPRTASPLPLAGLAMLMLFVGARGIRSLRRSL